jgi:hypothetical protein
MGPYPLGWVPDPHTYAIQTSAVGPGPPRVQTGPLGWDLDPPPSMGSGPSTEGSRCSRAKHTQALIKT